MAKKSKLREYNKYWYYEKSVQNPQNEVEFFNNKYNNNLIICSSKTLQKMKHKEGDKYKEVKVYFDKIIDIFMSRCNQQFEYLKKSNIIDQPTKAKFISSYKQHNNPFFNIINGKLLKKSH